MVGNAKPARRCARVPRDLCALSNVLLGVQPVQVQFPLITRSYRCVGMGASHIDVASLFLVAIFGHETRGRDLRELRLIVPNARSKAVRRRVGREVASLDRVRELDALEWIEAVAESGRSQDRKREVT